MKHTLFTLIICIVTLHKIAAQTYSTDSDRIELQTGLFGVWAHYEQTLDNKLAIKGEIGLDNNTWIDFNNGINYAFVPALIVEPRLYYNLNKRAKKGKNISLRSANYISIFTRFHPNWFVISNAPVGSIVPDLSIIPSWGLRRIIVRNFTCEAAFGLGYRCYFAHTFAHEFALHASARIGYAF